MTTAESGAVSEAVAQVEGELARFWAPAEGEAPKVRASTMNYVVVTAPGEAARASEAADQLAGTRPGRIFILTIDPKRPPWEVDASSSAVCHKEGDDVICYDRIELVFGAMSSARAPSVVSALALSEVQNIVEAGPGAPMQLVESLAKVADRVIVDSAHTAVSRIAELAKKTKAKMGDREFVRLFSWRDFVARFFDLDPAAARSIKSVRLARAISGTKLDPAPLVLGWLGGRLGWKFESKERAIDASGSAIAIALEAREGPGIEPGDLVGVRIAATVDGGEMIGSCERVGASRIVAWSITGPRAQSHQYPVGFRDETWVALKAIESTEGDRHYKDAVAAAAEYAAR